MPHVEVSKRIAAPWDKVWDTILDIEAYETFMENVRSVRILEAGSDRRRTAWSVQLKGSVLEWEEIETIDPAQGRIGFQQLDGDLEMFDGHWQVDRNEDGTVSVFMTVEFEIGIPLLADMLNPVASKALRENSEKMLTDLDGRFGTDSS